MKLPANITFFVPNLSSNLPTNGAQIAIEITSGRTMRLAFETDVDKEITAKDGKNIIATWLKPEPKDMPVASLTSLLLNRLICITGSSTLFSTIHNIGVKITEINRNGHT